MVKNQSPSLFTPVVPESLWHPNFKQMMNKDYAEERDLLDSWSKEILKRDGKGKLIQEFQKTFNSVFWEAYLNALFKYWNLSIDYLKPHPDYIIQDYNGICVEAAVANNEQGGTPEYINAGKVTDCSFVPNPLDKNEHIKFIEKSAIRIVNALTEKNKKYTAIYSLEPYVKDKPFAVAIAPFDRPGFWLQNSEPVIEVLYGYRNLFSVDFTSDPSTYERIDFITKNNGAEVSMGLFNEESLLENISGIIFSTTATFSKVQALTKSFNGENFLYHRYNANGTVPKCGYVGKSKYSETIDDGIQLFLNPHAKHQLPIEFIEKFPVVCSGAD